MTTEAKALALVNEIEREEGVIEPTPRIMRGLIMDEALCRAIEQHEAFRQEVSDAVKIANDRAKSLAGNTAFIVNHMQCFIIPAPKPDPLVEALDAMKDGRAGPTTESYAACLRAKLDALGYEIREKNDG